MEPNTEPERVRTRLRCGHYRDGVSRGYAWCRACVDFVQVGNAQNDGPAD